MRVRADKWLRERFPGLSGPQVEEALAAGWVLGLQRRRVRKGDRVDSLEVEALEKHLVGLRKGPIDWDVPVVHQGSDWVIVDKPAGLDGHPLKLSDRRTLTHWAFAKWPKTREEFPGVQPTLVPHRLDRGTSGLQIVALTARAYGEWRARFQGHRIGKSYLAWVWGSPTWDTLRATWPLAHHPSNRGRMVWVGSGVRHRPPVLEAETRLRVVDRKGDRALLEAFCRSGVTHQVRAHAAAAGLPLLGDALYDEEFGIRPEVGEWPCLRAVRLEGPDGSWDAPDNGFSKGPL